MNDGMVKMPKIFKVLEYIGENKNCSMQDLLTLKISVAYLINIKNFANDKKFINLNTENKKHLFNLSEKGTELVKHYKNLIEVITND